MKHWVSVEAWKALGLQFILYEKLLPTAKTISIVTLGAPKADTKKPIVGSVFFDTGHVEAVCLHMADMSLRWSLLAPC